MIDHLIEIIFKDVPENKIGELLKDLTSQGKEVLNYNLTCDVSEVDWNSEQSIEALFNQNKNFGLFLNLKALKKSHVWLPKCGISVYKYEDKINLEINFQSSDLDSSSFKQITNKLMELAESIAIQYKIEEYYCGLEPAEEKKTRLFTNQHVGPFFIEDK